MLSSEHSYDKEVSDDDDDDFRFLDVPNDENSEIKKNDEKEKKEEKEAKTEKVVRPEEGKQATAVAVAS